jgi:hypothetical protein
MLRGAVSSILLTLFFPSEALARRYTLQYPVTIDRNSATLSNSNRVGIANFLIDAQTTFAKDGDIVIYAYSDGTGRKDITLTKQRVTSTIGYLGTLGIPSKKINVEYNVWEKHSNVPPSQRYQLLFELLPGPAFHD